MGSARNPGQVGAFEEAERLRAVILAGGQDVQLRPLAYATRRRAVRFDGQSLAVNHIDQVENLGRVDPERCV